MTQEHVPVLIVGAGGAGLSLSLMLDQQNIPSLLIERRNEISWFPRARNLNFRTLEVFRGLGLDAQVHAAGKRVSRMFRKQSLAASEQEELLDPISLIEHLDEISPEPLSWYCPQSILEPLLLAEVRQRGGDVRYGTELISFTQDEEGVTAATQNRATGEVSEVRSEYLIAADGAHSKIRETLAMPTQGLGELPDSQIFVYFRANWGELIRGYEADAILVVNKDVRGLFLITDQDRGMFAVTYSPSHGESAQDYTAERCKSMILLALGKSDISVEIVDMADWCPIQLVADRFQDGRIFLVGDAAHTMPPYLGLGVNTAIQSAQNLAWKLAAVLKKQATPRLLATYQTERHPVGWLAAEQSLTGPAAVLFEKEIRGNSQSRLKKQLPLLYPIVGYRYRSEAILSEDATSLNDGIELLEPLELNGLPGTRMPHLWIERKGQPISTLDLLDGHFILLTGPDGIIWCETASALATTQGIELIAYRVGPDADLLDRENGWSTKFGVSSDGAVLLRPDGFVAWRCKTLPAAPGPLLEQVLAHILCR